MRSTTARPGLPGDARTATTYSCATKPFRSAQPASSQLGLRPSGLPGHSVEQLHQTGTHNRHQQKNQTSRHHVPSRVQSI